MPSTPVRTETPIVAMRDRRARLALGVARGVLPDVPLGVLPDVPLGVPRDALRAVSRAVFLGVARA